MNRDKFKKNRNTIYELTRKQVKTQYQGSSLGFIWTILHPLLNSLIMFLVFKELLGSSDKYFALYLLTGNILFAALRSSTTQALTSFVSNRGLLLRTKVSLHLFPLSNTLTSIVNLFFSLLALIPFMIWLSISEGTMLFSYRIAYLLLLLPAFLLFEYGVGLILSIIFVFFRDLKHIYSVFLTLWTYLTPIFYKPDRIKNDMVQKVLKINPMFHFLNYFRDSLYRGASGYDGADKFIGAFNPIWSTLGVCYLCAAVALLIGYSLYGLLKGKIITKI